MRRSMTEVQDFVHAGNSDAFAGKIEQSISHGQKVAGWRCGGCDTYHKRCFFRHRLGAQK